MRHRRSTHARICKGHLKTKALIAELNTLSYYDPLKL